MDGFKRPSGNGTGPNGVPRPIQPVQPPESIAPRMNDIYRPSQQTPPVRQVPMSAPVMPSQPRQPQASLSIEDASPVAVPKVNVGLSPKSKKHRWWWILLTIIALLALGAVVSYNWYQTQLTPVDAGDKTKHSVVIDEGTSFSEVVSRLHQQGVIRNTAVTELYARLNNKRSVKAGTCVVTKAQATATILDKLNAGCHDFKVITFYPGGTLTSSRYKASQSTDKIDKTSITYILTQAGYSSREITEALSADYSSSVTTLFDGKPASASLEGYLFGETYYVSESATAKEVVREALVQMQKTVDENSLVAKFKDQGLTLYQGITLASIVERELGCEDKPTAARKTRCYGYQQEIAQVFLKRLKTNMQLGSDVTFIYAADLQGVTPTVSIDSPYNTRKNTGLPPGPIAAPGELSLKAVANPASTDYLYFIAGDDGLIYFAKTDEEHQANIKNHCQELCNVL